MTKKDRELLAKKFDYIIYKDYIQVSEAMRAFDYGKSLRGMIGKFRDETIGSTLTPSHIKLLELECHIPKSIFEKKFDFDIKNIEDTIKMDKAIEDFRKEKQEEEKKELQYIQNLKDEIESLKKTKQNIQDTFPFYKNEELLAKLVGTWYAYSFGTSPKDGVNGIYTIETTIHDDQTVTDMNGNRGQLFLGHNQSTIIKESTNSRDLVTIVFSNTEVIYGRFHFSIQSQRNVVRRRMCNFGFFSKKKLREEEYMKILGDKIEEMQLQISLDFVERVSV